MNSKTELLLKNAASPISLPQYNKSEEVRMTLADPALSVMTDFNQTATFSIGQDEKIDHALLYMKAVGVRLLFALDGDRRPVGLITSSDIQGEKPMLYLQSIDCTHKICTRSDVFVKNIMTAVDQWMVIDYADAKKIRISQIVDALKAIGMRHLVVTEVSEESPGSIIRGIFSASRIEQATAIPLEIISTANSFAEIKQVIT